MCYAHMAVCTSVASTNLTEILLQTNPYDNRRLSNATSYDYMLYQVDMSWRCLTCICLEHTNISAQRNTTSASIKIRPK
jgi:hypothetical protein